MNYAYTGQQAAPSADTCGMADDASWSGRRRVGFIDVVRVAAQAARRESVGAMGGEEPETLVLVLQHAGRGGARQDGRSAVCGAGEAVLYASARAVELDYGAASRQTLLIMPAAEVRARLAQLDQLLCLALTDHTPAMEMVRQMAAVCVALPFDQMDQLSQTYAARALLEAVVSALALVPVPLEAPGPRMARFHLSRIKEYVSANLHDSELSVRMVSEALRISPSHIHRLFEGSDQTLSAWIWSQRLLACRKLLEDPTRAHLPISQVAYSQGFNNASHFARMFRTRFGSTPSAWRERGRA